MTELNDDRATCEAAGTQVALASEITETQAAQIALDAADAENRAASAARDALGVRWDDTLAALGRCVQSMFFILHIRGEKGCLTGPEPRTL